MTRLQILEYITYQWLFLFGVWLLASLLTKRTKRRESPLSLLAYSVVVFGGLLCVFRSEAGIGTLGRKIVPDTVEFAWLGFGITFAGILLSIWARFALGSNWSAAVTLKDDHELIRRGPYAATRHPMYSGFLLALTGTAVAMGDLRCALGLVLVTLGLLVKIRTEERLLVQQFGQAYTNYRKDVRALVPFIV